MKTMTKMYSAALLGLLLLALSGQAQTPPALLWQKALGGSGGESARAITATSDGAYIVAGETRSNDGDVSGYHGTTKEFGQGDYWVVKLSAPGDLIWQKPLGGSDADAASAVTMTADEGIVVAGSSLSNDGDVTGNHGEADFWVVKLDAAGSLVWQKSLGGSGSEAARAVTATPDGGFIVAGYTLSNDGDITGNHGDHDYWVVKLDAAGSLVWQKTLGGSQQDIANAITATSDGGVVVAGFTRSKDGDVSGNDGRVGAWVVKLDAAGKLVWQETLGGNSANAITTTVDGGFVVAGSSSSNDGDVLGNHGNNDYWVVKLNASGGLVWQKSLGGSNNDVARAVTATLDGGYVVAGYTQSKDGDVSGSHDPIDSQPEFVGDYWVVKLDAAGSLVWQKTLGGKSSDVAHAVIGTSNGDFVVAGQTHSDDGDVTGYHGGGNDFALGNAWVVKLKPAPPAITSLAASPSPVCTGQPVRFTATVGDVTGPYNYTLTNGAGSTIQGTASGPVFSQSLTVGGSGSQTYTLTVATVANGSSSATVLVTVNAPPDASFAGLAAAYCTGAAAVTLLPATPGGQFSGPGVAGSTFTAASAGSGGSVTYAVSVNGCANSSSRSVAVNPPPAVNPGPNQSVTLGFGSNCTSISATATGAAPITYMWDNGAGSGATVSVCPQATTTYQVRATDANGCTSAPAQVTVTVKDVRCGPGNQFVTVCYYGTTQCVQSKVAERYLSLGGTLGGCGATGGRIGVEESQELPLSLTLKAYPNPTPDAVTVRVLAPQGGVAQFEVLDAAGRARQTRREELVEGLNEVEFRLGKLPAGLYLIRCIDTLHRHATVRVDKR